MRGPKKAFLLGAGGHAKMIIEAIRSQNDMEIECCLSRKEDCNKTLLGVSVLEESIDRLVEFRRDGLFGIVAIGDNRLRKRLTIQLLDLGFELPNVIAKSAYISPSAVLGVGNIVMPGAIVGAETCVRNGCILNCGSSIDHDNQLADFVHIGPGSHLAGNVRVEEGAFLGVGTSVIPEVTIGGWATLGAGAVAIRNIPPNQVWVGCPARQVPHQHTSESSQLRLSA